MASDFRGYVQQKAPQYLDYVGNDVNGQGTTGINISKLLSSNLVDSTGADPSRSYEAARSGIQNLYGQYANSQAASSATPPADLSSYDQSIGATQSQINNLTPGLNNSLQAISNSYQTTLNNLNNQKSQTDTAYNQNKTADRQDYVTNKNTINTNTGSTISSLSRLLGSRGAGGQSAGDYAALLAGKAGTQQLTGAGGTFAKNQQGLDTSYNNFNQTYEQNIKNADLEKNQNQNAARASFNTNKANLLQSLAGLVNQRTSAAGGRGVGASQGYVNEANQLLSEANNLGAVAPVAAQQALRYEAPSLASYTANPTAIGVDPSAGAASESATPFLQTLLNRDKERQAA